LLSGSGENPQHLTIVPPLAHIRSRPIIALQKIDLEQIREKSRVVLRGG